MVMYIDDRNIWVSSSSLKTNTQILQAAYKAVSKKLADSGLAIDTNKCELIHFTRRKHDTNVTPSISIPNTQETNTTIIPPSPHIKWLGITFNSKLNFYEHVCRTALKAEATLGGLYMLGNTLKGLSADTPLAPSPRVDRSWPKRSDAYWSSTQNADATTLRTCKVDDILLSILTIATPGDRGLSHL
jgi:hypothetical protein